MSGHAGEFKVATRDNTGKATKWMGTCECGDIWTGADYYEVDEQWAAHCGKKPLPRPTTIPALPAPSDPPPATRDAQGKVPCPWCPTHKHVRLRTNGTFYRHQPYGKNVTGNAVPECPGSSKSPQQHPKYVPPAVKA